MTTYASSVSLNLGNVPIIEDRELYEELLTIHSALEVVSDFINREQVIITVSGNHTVQDTEGTVRVNAQALSIVITLPVRTLETVGYKYSIKRIDTNAANQVIVEGAGADVIDILATRILSPQEAITVQSNGVTGWDIL